MVYVEISVVFNKSYSIFPPVQQYRTGEYLVTIVNVRYGFVISGRIDERLQCRVTSRQHSIVCACVYFGACGIFPHYRKVWTCFHLFGGWFWRVVLEGGVVLDSENNILG